MEKTISYLSKLINSYSSKIIGSNYQKSKWLLDPARPLPNDFVRQSLERETFNRTNMESILHHEDDIFLMKQRPPIDMRKPYRVLCLDGGGVRGILTLKLLQRISKKHPNFMDQVDFICGTSAGGILALLLASDYTIDECLEIYSFAIPHIFSYNRWRAMNPFNAKYCDIPKREIMQYYFKDKTFGDLKRTCAVVAFRLDGRKSHTHSFFDKEGDRQIFYILQVHFSFVIIAFLASHLASISFFNIFVLF
jgi:hypothetical protein